MAEKVDAFTKQILDSFDEMIELLEVLRSDVLKAHELLKTDRKNQFFRRTLVRVVWVMLEGVTYSFKHWLLTICDLGKEPLSLKERAFLTEITFELDKEGSWKCKSHRIQTLQNIKRCFKLVAKKMPFNWSPDYSTQDWKLLQKSLLVRHRVTHPKKALMLKITEEEVRQINAAACWLLMTFNDFSEKAFIK